MRLGGLFVLVAAAALLVAGGAPAAVAATELRASVGPDFDIQLFHPDGRRVTQLDPGTYDITVRDLATEHNFHLTGPGVNESTGVETTGTVTWTVTFREGRYLFVCDPHSDDDARELRRRQPAARAHADAHPGREGAEAAADGRPDRADHAAQRRPAGGSSA